MIQNSTRYQDLWLKNYPKNVSKEITFPQEINIVAVMKEALANYRDRDAFTNMGVALTYQEVDRLSDQFAAFLQNHLHLQKGDRIAIQMPNLLQFPVALFGAFKAGLVVVNTNPLYTASEMRHQFQDSGAKAVVILANFGDHLEKILKETSIEHVITTEVADLFPPTQKMARELCHSQH